MSRKAKAGLRDNIRKHYYNLFSLVYDFIIRVHSRDPKGRLRKYLVERAGVSPGENVLDVCTGTGSVAIEFSKKVGNQGTVMGVDFSRGMLKKAKSKAIKAGLNNFYLIEAKAGELPFKNNQFRVVTLSYALYELKSEERKKTIAEMARLIKEGGSMLVMEHEVPKHILLRVLFYIRMYTMGSRDTKDFLKSELNCLQDRFQHVTKEVTPGGRSKIIFGRR
jgi:demethylmenaquinone methyltransferase/2-methoxy-6-polyprenyl-1,4-benzoquinol methylase